MTPEHSQLAVSVYILAMKKQIEEEVKSKYLKRIEYLVGANNELMNRLEECEKECYGRGVSQRRENGNALTHIRIVNH